jgi:hypothetical protein
MTRSAHGVQVAVAAFMPANEGDARGFWSLAWLTNAAPSTRHPTAGDRYDSGQPKILVGGHFISLSADS